MTLQRLVLLIISLTPLVLAGLIWNLSIENSSELLSSASTADELPQSILSDLTFNQYDQQGRLVQQLQTSQATSFIAGQEVELVSPRLLVTGSNEVQWSASSESGLLDRPGSQLVLRGDVLLQRLGDTPAQLATESLFWLPATASAYTSDLVTIDAPGSHIESEGISIDLDRSIFVFHSQVRGTHERN